MARRAAVVIGIDGYANPAWSLDGSVRDALSFADWALRSGGVAPADLRLLLSPAPGAPPPALPTGAPSPSPATSQAIIDALAALRRLKPEEGGDRAYVYYAGHGAALPLWNTEPILIPVDFADPETQSQLLLGFSRLIPYLSPAPFSEQLFFFDACRDFSLPGYEPPLQSPVGPYRPAAPGKVRQYVFYSVAPGQRAAALGMGIWTASLLDALEGRSYQPISRRGAQYEVTLSHLAAWIGGEVETRIENALLRDAARYVQSPEYVPDPRGGDPVLATYTKDTVPKVSLQVFVEPAHALGTCKVAVKQYVDGLGEEIDIAAGPPPPLLLPVPFSLRPSDYSIQAQADRFTLLSRPWTLEDDPVVELTLAAAPPAAPAAPSSTELAEHSPPDEITRGSFGLDDLEVAGVSPRRGGPREAERTRGPAPTRGPAAPRPGTLTVQSRDPYLRVKLLDARKREVKERLDPGVPLRLLPGIYRLRSWMPGDRPVEKTVEVRSGAETVVPLAAPSQLGDLQRYLLDQRGINTDLEAGKPAYLFPSEVLGAVTGLHLSSLLVYAAYAADQPGPNFNKLRSFGVPPLAVGEGEGGVVVLAGVAGGDRTPAEIAGFLAGCRAALLDERGEPAGDTAAGGGFTALPGLPAAGGWQTIVRRPGARVLELRLPGFGATRYAVAPLPGRIAVLAASLEPDGRVDVQQLLVPVPGGPRLDGDLLNGKPQNTRLADLALRAWAAHEREPLAGHDLEDLLAGTWFDPLLACVAGYALVRAGEPERFVGKPKKGALAHLCKLYPDLPDAWVLAGLCDPAGEAEWFAKAAACGVPVFAEGLRALGAAAGLARPPFLAEALAEALAGQLPASSWTAWVPPLSPTSKEDKP